MNSVVFHRWFHFEKVVEALVANEIHHMELNELLKYTKRFCHIDKEDELEIMLKFYHDLGVIVKHGRTVVLQALWLIDLFKQLINVRPYDERVNSDTLNNNNKSVLGLSHSKVHIAIKLVEQFLIDCQKPCAEICSSGEKPNKTLLSGIRIFNAPYSQMAALLKRASGQTRKRGVLRIKLQIIGEVTELTLMSVLFRDEDTPGSFLAGRNPAELKNEELRFWVKCRNGLGKGLRTEAQLVKR